MDKIDWSTITPESLEEQNIFGLRNIARSAGIPSPTTLNKATLIEKILEVKATKVEEKPVEQPKMTVVLQDNNKQQHFADDTKPAPTDKGENTEEQAATTDDEKKAETEGEEDKKEIKRGKPAEKRDKDGFRTVYINKDVVNGKNPKTQKEKPQKQPPQEEEISLDQCEIRSGILEILPDGYGFLRASNFRNSPKDSYVPAAKIRRIGLRMGDLVTAYCKPATTEGKPPAVVSVESVNGQPLEYLETRKNFDALVPIFPLERLRLELKGQRNDLAVRAIDIIAPIGKGQRAMVVSPPKAGKTTLLKMIANSISINHPECKLMVLLIDERPEEVTDMQRSTKGEVIYSTFDEESDNHIKVAELVLARAKRMVEDGQDVVILLDSLTRMARASNVIVPSSGKTLSGGVDPVALYMPKRFFGAARNIENGGSLTIIATALVDTGSRMDDIVYEEFKGTGNMEIHLDRRLSEKRIFPAIDLLKSGTRREELLLSQKELEGAYAMRRLLSAGDNQEAAETIINMMQKTISNEELIVQLGLQLVKLQKDGFRI